MKKLFNLIKADVITMNGGKNSLKVVSILVNLMFGTFSFIISPIGAIYIPFFTGIFFVSMLFQNEIKYHSIKMLSLIPVERKDVVRSRFLLIIGGYTITCVLFYFLMLLSSKLKLYFLLGGNDIIQIIIQNTSFSTIGFLNIIYAFAFSFGMIIASSTLRKYFKDENCINPTLDFTKIKKFSKNDILPLTLIISFVILYVLIITGVIPISSAVSLIAQIFSQIAQATDGFLMGLIIVTVSFMEALYQYVCTVLEYEKREL